MNNFFKILLCFCFVSNAQNSATIDYKYSTKAGTKTTTWNATLKCNASQFMYQFFNVEEKDEKKHLGDGEIHVKIKSKFNQPHSIYDVSKKHLYQLVELDNIMYKVKEEVPKMNWELSSDKKDVKKIGNFTCNKATLNFRGRNYEAWYTTKIPLSYGPWKFRGLPGLILEIYDTSYFYHWAATNVTYPVKQTLDLKFVEKNKPQEITLKQFVEKTEKAQKLRAQLVSKRLPKGATFKITRGSIELKYDWETDVPKKKSKKKK